MDNQCCLLVPCIEDLRWIVQKISQRWPMEENQSSKQSVVYFLISLLLAIAKILTLLLSMHMNCPAFCGWIQTTMHSALHLPLGIRGRNSATQQLQACIHKIYSKVLVQACQLLTSKKALSRFPPHLQGKKNPCQAIYLTQSNKPGLHSLV